MLRVSGGVDDLMRMQRRVADLDVQQGQAEACGKQIAALAKECKWPGNSRLSRKPSVRSHEFV
jgi:hypothetical protein